MTQDNLYDSLEAGSVEQEELEHVLLNFFSGASAISPTEIVYPGEETTHALRLVYKKNDLVGILSGPGLKDDQLEQVRARIRADLIESQASRIGRAVLFALKPVEGCFRYKDIFQIMSIPNEAPRPNEGYAAHPFILEFRFPVSRNASVRHLRRMLREREFELLLAALIDCLLSALGHTVRKHWVLTGEESPETWRSEYRQEMYHWPGLVPEAEEYSSTEGMMPIGLVEPVEYYGRYGVSVGRPLDLSSDFHEQLERFEQLPKHEHDQFLRACFWFQHSQLVHTYSRSAAFTALISAIEALIDPPRGEERCEKCDKPTGPGLRQLFIDFVERFAPGLPRDDRDKLYKLRSALSHGGTLLHSDRRGWGALSAGQVQEWANVNRAQRVVRVVLIEWLRQHGDLAASER